MSLVLIFLRSIKYNDPSQWPLSLTVGTAFLPVPTAADLLPWQGRRGTVILGKGLQRSHGGKKSREAAPALLLAPGRGRQSSSLLVDS